VLAALHRGEDGQLSQSIPWFGVAAHMDSMVCWVASWTHTHRKTSRLQHQLLKSEQGWTWGGHEGSADGGGVVVVANEVVLEAGDGRHDAGIVLMSSTPTVSLTTVTSLAAPARVDARSIDRMRPLAL